MMPWRLPLRTTLLVAPVLLLCFLVFPELKA